MSQDGQRPHLAPYERADRPVVGYAHDYADGHHTGMHQHPRAQLLYARAGVMRIATERAAFVVPPGTGLFVPQATRHAVRMDGAVAMRALFLRADAAAPGPAETTAIAVSPLLRELILAACAEATEWDMDGRVPHIAALVVDEIGRAEALRRLSVPMPEDPRLRRVAAALLADPADPRDLAAHGAAAGASARTLARLFLRETGMGFQHWRRHLRLVQAMVELSAGAPLSRAAAAAGYASIPAFGAAFLAVFGRTPGSLRR